MVTEEDLLNLLGNETRRRILQLLAIRPMFVTEISEELRVGRKAILEHLSYLERMGVIRSRISKSKVGRPRKYYELSTSVTIHIEIRRNKFTIEVR